MENVSATSFQVLVQTAQELSLAQDMNRVMEIVCTAARSLTGADGATFVLKEDQHCYYAEEDAISPLWKGRRFPMTACVSGWAMINRKPVVSEDIFADPATPVEVYQSTFVKSLAIVPIRTNDPIGAIGNYWAARRMPLPQEVWLLQSLADITAAAMENVNRYTRLEERVKERTRQLEAANKEMETFTYTVAHDLRAPLRIMTGYSSMLQEGHALTDEQKRLTNRIVAGGIKMADMIDGLLQFYRSQRNEINRSLITVHKLVEELTEEIKKNEPQRNIQFHLHAMPNAEADQALLKQVWMNVLSNSVKYTANTPQAIIEVGGEQKGESNIYYIKDNGIGFDMADYDQLFKVFKRLPGAEKFDGSGIGLASVQRIIARHGGELWAESKTGEGATFYFSLPRGAELT
ncbi:MAG TPA: ATP-binding protein [Niastella sp.]|nr:ATP-binding protein [Niastella sp.]